MSDWTETKEMADEGKRKKYAEPGDKLYSFIQWLQLVKGGPSLPSHLEFKLHNDWPIGLRWVPRELTAFGPRSQTWEFGWRRFPVYLSGYTTTRWMDKHDKEVHVGHCQELRIWPLRYEDCGPSPLQKNSKFSWHVSWPLHFSISYVQDNGKPWLFRIGCRWDSLDVYYTLAIYVGGSWN